MRRWGASVMAFVAAVSLPATFAFTSEPVYAAATDGSSALADIEEWFSPTTSLQSIPGGAGAGLGTAGELSGSALEVSGEVAGVAADGAISLTPVGWAIAAGLATAAGGYYAWKSRGAIIGAVNSVWNSLSSSQQSSLEKTNAPGDTVSLPSGPFQSYLEGLSVNIPGTASTSYAGAVKVAVPSSLASGAVFAITVVPRFPTSGEQAGINVWAVGSGISATSQSASGYGSSGSGYWSETSGSGSGVTWEAQATMDTSFTAVGTSVFRFGGLVGGSSVYLQGWYGSSGYSGSYFGWSPVLSSGVPVMPSGDTSASGVLSISEAAVPNASSAAVPPSEVPPAVSSSAPSFFPGTYQPGTGVEPIGNPAPNPVVAPQSSPGSLPSGAPSPGFVTFLEDLFVPNPVQIEDALAPLEDAFANRIPFSYVKGTLSLLPLWADGVGSGGCADFPIPSFGLNNPANPGHSGSNFTASVCPGGFMSGAFSLLKSAFTVILWAFLLGWGVFMFASLMRNG